MDDGGRNEQRLDEIARSSGACPYCDQPRAIPGSSRCQACQGLLLIDGRYEVGALLGRGGTSAVYQGRDRLDDTLVAIKVLSLQDTRDWKALDLFERGTAILKGLNHPAIPRVFAFTKDAGRCYQVREYYAAGNLETLVSSGVHLDRKRVHFLLRDLLTLLDYLHTRVPAVLHRDVKPANIMFRDVNDLRPALIDYDTAAADGPQGTGTTIVVSPGYTAPEQLAGDAQPASDLYSLGMTMLFVLTHKPPLSLPRSGGKLELTAVLAGLEPATRKVIRKLVELDVAQRYPSARDALRELAGLPPTVGEAAGSLLVTSIDFTRKFGMSLFRVAVVLLAAALLGYFFMIAYVYRPVQSDHRGMDASQ